MGEDTEYMYSRDTIYTAQLLYMPYLYGRGTVTRQYTYLGSLEDVEALETTGIVAVPAVTGGNKHLGITRH